MLMSMKLNACSSKIGHTPVNFAAICVASDEIFNTPSK